MCGGWNVVSHCIELGPQFFIFDDLARRTLLTRSGLRSLMSLLNSFFQRAADSCSLGRIVMK